MKFVASLVIVWMGLISAASAGQLVQRHGWIVIDTKLPFQTMSERLDTSVKANKMGIVTTASASEGAKAQGFTILGNRVVGVYRNDFARRMLEADLAAGIEAPIRLYLVENADHTSTLAYRKPTAVFEPYVSGNGTALKRLAAELDVIF